MQSEKDMQLEIVQSKKDMELEIEQLRRKLQEQDQALETMKKEKAEQDFVIQKLMMRPHDGTSYHVLERSLALAHRSHDVLSTTPVVRHFLNLGVKVADVGVRRLTPWNDSVELDAKLVKLAPYLDDHVVSPQLNAARKATVAICGPAVAATSEALTPYIKIARPYADRVGEAAAPAVKAARPILLKVWNCVQPWLQAAKDELRKLAEDTDAAVDAKLSEVNAEDVFQSVQENVQSVADFAKDHQEDFAA